MGRHGKNRGKSPNAPAYKESPPTYKAGFPSVGPIDVNVLLHRGHDQVRQEREKMYEQALASCFAVSARILLNNLQDILAEDVSGRLPLWYSLFKRYHDELGEKNEKQAFAEWYWEATTGNELIRKADEEVIRMAKKYQKELSAALKKHIDEHGYTMADVCPGANVSKGVWYNVVGGATCSKKSFDDIAKYVGFDVNADEYVKQMYMARFNVGNNDTARIDQHAERMEEMALEVEKADEEEKLNYASTDELMKEMEKPEPEAEETAEEEEPELVLELDPEAEEEAEDVPYKDVPEMYREAKPQEEETEAPDPDFIVSPYAIMNSLAHYEAKLPKLKDDLESMKKEVQNLEKFIKLIELLKA